MASYTQAVKDVLRANGCRFERPGKGDHEIWFSPVTKRRFPVDGKILSRHTANAVLRQAGIAKQFDFGGREQRILSQSAREIRISGGGLVKPSIVLLGLFCSGAAHAAIVVSGANVCVLSTGCSISAPGGNTTYTFTSSYSVQTVTNAVTQRIDLYATHIQARIQGGALLFDQVFAMPFVDAAVAAAVQSAGNTLLANGAVSLSGPLPVSSSSGLQSSVLTSSQSDAVIKTYQTTLVASAPATLRIGDIGLCAGFTELSATAGNPFGCDAAQGTLFAVGFSLAEGFPDTNFDLHTHEIIARTITDTTTETYLTTRIYEITGFTAADVPEPATFNLAASAILLLGYAVRGGRRLHK